MTADSPTTERPPPPPGLCAAESGASLLVGLSCLCLAGASGYWAARPTPAAAPPPLQQLTVEPSTVPFGEVESADTLWAEAVVTNRFAQPLTIDEVSRSCSCVQSGVAQKELDPGEATTLRVGWRMAGKRGAARETVMLLFRVGGRTEHIPFVLTATVRPQAGYSPERLRFAPGDPAEQVLTVRAERAGHAVRVLEATCATKAVTATVAPDGQTVRVTVDRAVPVPAGLRHTLMVRVDGFDGSWLEVPIQFDADESQPRF